MRGHVTCRRGKWFVVVDLPRDPLTPKKRNQKWIGTDAATKKEAEKERTRILREMDTGVMIAPTTTTVSDYAGQWVASKRKIARTSREAYERTIRTHIAPLIGDLPLSSVQPLHIREWLARVRARGLAEATVSTVFIVLHAMFEDAVRLEVIVRNPARYVERPSRQFPERQIWDATQARHFMAAIKGDRFEALYLTAIGTGLRKGELLALRWRDVDLEKRVIVVRQGQVRVKGGTIVTKPKSRNSVRAITIPIFVAEALADHRQVQDAERMGVGELWEANDLVFCQSGGGNLAETTLDWHWRGLRRRLVASGLPSIHFHDLRHLHATLGLRAGIDPKTISKRLGHYSAGFTLDRYGHVTPDMAESAAEVFDGALGGDD